MQRVYILIIAVAMIAVAMVTVYLISGEVMQAHFANSTGSNNNVSKNLADSAFAAPNNLENGVPPDPKATLVFSYPAGFSNVSGVFHLPAVDAPLNGSAIQLTNSSYGVHQASTTWYMAKQNISSFTTDFTFRIGPTGYGATFIIQNTNNTLSPEIYGYGEGGDANLFGYGHYLGQYPEEHSVAIKFDAQGDGILDYLNTPTATGLYINGAPANAFLPQTDLQYSGIDVGDGDIMDAHIVYDGNVLTMVLKDINTGVQARLSWPINIPAIVHGNYAWVGFGAGTIPPVSQDIYTWSYWDGYNTELAAPTFSLAPGSYTSQQTDSISGPSGATIYYTIDGENPTTSSIMYTGPITINSEEIVKAIAVESGYTDSYVATANYQIAPQNTPLINFSHGFASSSNLISLNGYAQLNKSGIQLARSASGGGVTVASAWYKAPVNIRKFNTTFTMSLSRPNGYGAYGLTFVIQDQTPSDESVNDLYVSGGPHTVGIGESGLGYIGINSSVAVIFYPDFSSSNDLTGLYTNGTASHNITVNMISSGVNINSEDPLNVTLGYNGVVLTETVKDTVTGNVFATNYNVNIPAIVGNNTAYIGFTGSAYYSTPDQIDNWTFNSS